MAHASLKAVSPSRSESQPRAWQRMLSGRRLNLLDPSPLDIEIEDIAHGLARLARWNGQTLGDHAFSVAQHSLLVERILRDLYAEPPRSWCLAALLHDGPEFVVGDLISPFKAAIGADYRAIEARLLRAIHMRFGLPPDLPATITHIIKRADRIAGYFEAVGLAGFSQTEAERLIGSPKGIGRELERELTALRPMPAPEAQSRFLARFRELSL